MVALTVVAAAASTPAAAARADICVGTRPGCVPSLQTAVDQAAPGATIRIDAGRYAGGVTVTESVAIIGAGQGKTVLDGGGPVLTVGSFGDPTPPTVRVQDLTITGGRTTTSEVSRVFSGQDGVWALGGGMEIPPGAPTDDGLPGPGATVTLTRTTVSGNRAAPTATLPSGLPCPGGVDCPFAFAGGGGIDSWGNLTLVDSVVRSNRAGVLPGLPMLASDAAGGGIRSWVGTLTLVRTRTHRNAALAAGPNGRFAEGGGIFHGAGFFPAGDKLVMRDSAVTENRARLDAALPNEVSGTPIDLVAIGGGMQLTGDVTRTVIAHSLVARNTAHMSNSVGAATAFAGGVLTNIPTPSRIVHSAIRHNRATAETVGGSRGDAHADTGALQLNGTLVRSDVRGNRVRASSGLGDAEALAGAMWVQAGRVLDSRIRSNRLAALAPTGTASVRGAGAVVDKPPDVERGGLVVRGSRVTRNVGVSTGRVNVARGGGIFDAQVTRFGPFGGPLALIGSVIERNRLRPADVARGGGLYLRDQRLVIRATRIRRNDPDDCVGCAAAPDRSRARAAADQPSRSAVTAAHGLAHSSLPSPLLAD